MSEYLWLTPREKQYLEALAAGKSSVVIAYSLNVDTKTVTNTVWNLKRRFEAPTRGHLVWKAYHLGLISVLPTHWQEGKDKPEQGHKQP